MKEEHMSDELLESQDEILEGLTPESESSTKDRFTTQDLTEIDQILSGSEFPFDEEDARAGQGAAVIGEVPIGENAEVPGAEAAQGGQSEGEAAAARIEPEDLEKDEPGGGAAAPAGEDAGGPAAPNEGGLEATAPVPETRNAGGAAAQNPAPEAGDGGKRQAKPADAAARPKPAGGPKPGNGKKRVAPRRGNGNGRRPNGKSNRRKGLPRKTKPRTWTKTLAIFLGMCVLLGCIGVGGVYLFYTANFTDISNTVYTPKEKTEIYTSDNVQIASIFTENRNYVSIEQVPQDLKNALVATEDSRFYTHHGIDYYGMARALVSNIIGGNSTGQGASTITQQLARLLYLPDIATESTFMDSLNRKFKEISISFQMEDKYTKDQILEMYLNEYYFGSAAYGIEAASETYFGKNVSQLNLAESAMLAGLPQAPSVYAPNQDMEQAKARQMQVLNRMVASGYITQEQADEAYNTPLTIMPWSESDINNQIAPGYQNFVQQVIASYARAVAPSIMKERGLTQDEAESYARQSVAGGGYKFYTTISSTCQADAIDQMEASLSNFGYDQELGYTGALVSVDKTGAVRAYYGGNEGYSDIDMASSPRQPGSNIKPLYYSMGLETGAFTPGSIITDMPINIGGYSPGNSDGSYNGPITFTQSLVLSKNTTSVQIFNALGVQGAIDWLKQFGFDSITDDDYNLAVALGGLTYGIKPYQMAAAFNTFNNGGVYNQAYFIDRVTTSNGTPVADKNSLGLVSRQIMSPTTAAGMWGIMQQVVTNGTGTNAQCGLPTAGKTGTTDNSEDLWFTGMTGNITTSVWLGHLDHLVIGGGSNLPAAVYGAYTRRLINQGVIE